jgi:hypothetical protein
VKTERNNVLNFLNVCLADDYVSMQQVKRTKPKQCSQVCLGELQEWEVDCSPLYWPGNSLHREAVTAIAVITSTLFEIQQLFHEKWIENM